MAITFVGAQEVEGTSIDITANVGDAIVLAVMRDGSTLAPSLPNDLPGLSLGSSAALWLGVFGLIAKTANPTFSGFTNATRLAAAVYRSSGGNCVLPRRSSNQSTGAAGSGGTVTYPPVNTIASLTECWQVGVMSHRSNDVDIETAPSGMINRVASSGGTGKIAIHDTDSTALSWASTSYTLTTGTSAQWRSCVVEVAEFDYAPASGGTSRPSNPFLQQVIG
jgi:hypothetical protein